MSIEREPAIRRAVHPAADLPERPSRTKPPAIPTTPASAAGGSAEERLTEQHNVRLRPSTKARLLRAVDKLRYETGDRTISIASITDKAIVEYLDSQGC
ncbi:hypothetical protein [Dietzia psychralcaliphila]|uniref:hypothetical protein n=1 Tax=Dietzia sp. MNB45 TaxID=3238800 RepID=UPI000D300BBB